MKREKQDMENFEFISPTKFIFEEDADLRCGEEVAKVSDNVLFVHYGDDFTYKSGLRDRIVGAFEKSNITVYELPGVEPNPKIELARKGIEMCKEHKIQYIVAVGGGSVIDTAKAVALGAVYDGDVWDFFTKEATPTTSLPVGVVMTLPATGSEASGGSVMNDGKSNINLDVIADFLRPDFALLNPNLTLGIPKRQSGFGVIDMFSHVLERYMSDSKNVNLVDRMAESVMISIIDAGRKVMENPTDINARGDLMWAAIVAHNGLLGVGRNQDWASHAIAAQLSANYNTVHGAALSVIIPSWATYVMDSNLDRFTQFAARVWNIEHNYYNPRETAVAGIKAMQDFFLEMGGFSSLTDLNIGSEKLSDMAKTATQFGNIGNIKSLDASDVEEIYKKAV